MDRPDWVDAGEYPFRSRWYAAPAGRLHYVDEGQGRPVVFVHGTPTWSFEFRHLVRGLTATHRCLAPDHLGFGLSDKPRDWPYRVADHADNLRRLLDDLAVSDVTLVVHDFGGPIGLAWALDHPDRVRSLVLLNTFMWRLDEPRFRRVSRFVASPLGRFLYLRLNFSPRVILRQAMRDRRHFTAAIHRHYLRPFPTPADRMGAWTLGRELSDAGDWYDGLWRRRNRIAGRPALIVWGLEDVAFRRKELDRFRALFPAARTVELAGVGHFPHEERPDEVLGHLRAFLA
jgi:haloalkane dehalogenase